MRWFKVFLIELGENLGQSSLFSDSRALYNLQRA